MAIDFAHKKQLFLDHIWAYSALGLHEDAVKEASDLTNIDPDDPVSHMELGICCEDTGNIGRAIEYYRQTIERFPDYSPAYVNLGYIFEKHKKRTDMAILCYEKAAALNPRNEWALNNIASILSKEGKWQDALCYYKKAHAASEQNDHILHNLAWAHYRCGHYGTARRLYSTLVSKHPDNPAMHCDLGCVVCRQGKHREALHLFEKALLIKPNDRRGQRLWKITRSNVEAFR